MDINAIASAIAARFAPAIVSPPSGYRNIRIATDQLPEGAPQTPGFYVFGPTDSEFDWGASVRAATLKFTGHFLYAPIGADGKRDTVGLRKWFGVLLGQPLTKEQLGLTYVQFCRIDGARLSSFSYAGQDYLGVELDIIVRVYEPVSPTA